MYEQRLMRTELMLGTENINKIKNSFVVIVGLGAVGSYATEAIARCGIGRMRVIDFDIVCPTNINRQLYALTSTIGKKKCDLAKERILKINPDCNVEAVDCFVKAENMDVVFKDEPDIIIDAIDALNPKVELIACAMEKEVPIISSMGAALRTDPSYVKVGKLKKVHHCPLAKQVRKRLRRRGVSLDVECVYSHQKAVKQAIQANDSTDSENSIGRPRNILGSLPTITGIFGLTIANEVIRFLTNDFEEK